MKIEKHKLSSLILSGALFFTSHSLYANPVVIEGDFMFHVVDEKSDQDETQSAEIDSVTNAVRETLNNTPAPHPNQCDFSYLKFNDIKYVMEYDSTDTCHLKGTTTRLHQAALEDPDLFLNLGLNITYPENGATGPRGFKNSNGSKYIITNKSRSDVSGYSASQLDEERRLEMMRNKASRKNIIFGIEIEEARDITHLVNPDEGYDRVYDFDLIVFAHSDQLTEGGGYFFKRLKATYNLLEPQNNRLSVRDHGPVIPLSNTDFKAMISLSGKKFILKDDINNITKVFPITVGGFDIRSQIDGVVESMTLQVPKTMYEHAKATKPEQVRLHKEYQPFDNAFLTKPSENFHYKWNTEARTQPAAFRGRPYLSFIDENLKDENAESEIIKFGYRLVALHDKIVSGKLTRSESSHGCQRMEDKNLYQVFAIVENSTKGKTPIYVNYELDDEFKRVDNLMTVTDVYKTVEYTNKTISRAVTCKSGGSYLRRDYQDQYNQTFYTFSDSGCGSSMKKRIGYDSNSSISQEVYEYILGRSTQIPETQFTYEGDHYPSRWNDAISNLQGRGFPEVFLEAYARVEGQNQGIRRITALERLSSDSSAHPSSYRLEDYLSQNQISQIPNNIRYSFQGFTQNAELWPIISDSRRYALVRSNIHHYESKCAGKVVGSVDPDHNCRGFYQHLLDHNVTFY